VSDPGVTVAAARWRAAFAHRGFNLFQASRLASVLGVQMQSVAIGWQIYAVTGRAIDLAWVGLAQFLPAAGLSLVTGHVADRVERRRILVVCHAAMAVLSTALLLIARAQGHGASGGRSSLVLVYAVLVGVGVARAFQGPASQSLLPSLVPPENLHNALAWSSSLWQTATIFGPMLGGIAYAALGGAAPVYAIASACMAGAACLAQAIGRASPSRNRSAATRASSGTARFAPLRSAATRASSGTARFAPLRSAATRASVLDGVRYVRANQIVLGAISLDLFAVLLGGATALLPVYARDILNLGPWALGVLRSAPAAGAAITGIVLALYPIERRAGAKMLASVALFGVATIAFGLSRNFALSVLALAAAGASDMVSVVVRSALVQLATPDAMRGRVSAVNMVFIGASNELGEFESGLVAQWLGAVASVVTGGIGTLLVVAIWAWRFPKLRGVDRLRDAAHR
jgi:MFS family permease